MMKNLLLLLVFAVLSAVTVARPTTQELLAVDYLGAVRSHDGAITQENAFQKLRGGRVRRSGKGKKKGRWNPGSFTILGAVIPKGWRG